MSITHVQAEALGKALYRKRGMNKADPKAIARFNRAALELAGGVDWAYDPQTEVLTMGSTTTAGVTYTVTFLSCTCKAGAKGLNLAVCDVVVLARAFAELAGTGSTAGLDSYSSACLRRVWRAEHFSWFMTTTLHTAPGQSPFDTRLQLSQLDRIAASRHAAAELAENYAGPPVG